MMSFFVESRSHLVFYLVSCAFVLVSFLAFFVLTNNDDAKVKSASISISAVRYLPQSEVPNDLNVVMGGLAREAEFMPSQFFLNDPAQSGVIEVVFENITDEVQSVIFDTNYPFAMNGAIYINDSSIGWRKVYANTGDVITTTPYFSRDMSALIDIEPGGNHSLLVAFERRRAAYFDLSFYDLDIGIERNNKTKFRLGVILGILLLLSITNFLFYFALKKNYFLLYSGQELSVAILFFLDRGLALEFLIPGQQVLNSQLTTMLTPILGVFSMLFAFSFLNLKKDAPHMLYVFTTVCAVMFFGFFLSFFPALIPFVSDMIPIMMLVYPLVIVLAGLISIKKRGVEFAGYFTLAWLLLVVFKIAFAFSRWDLLSLDPLDHFSVVHIGYAVEGLVLALAMALRVSAIRERTVRNEQKMIGILQERMAEIADFIRVDEQRRVAISKRLSGIKDFASASHDIHHNLYTIKLHLEQFKFEYGDSSEVMNISRSVNSLQGLTTEAITAAKEDHENNLEEFDVHAVFSNLCEKGYSIDYLEGAAISVNTSTCVRGSPIIFARIIQDIAEVVSSLCNEKAITYSVADTSDDFIINIFTQSVINNSQAIKPSYLIEEDAAIATELSQQVGYELATRVEGGVVHFLLTIPKASMLPGSH